MPDRLSRTLGCLLGGAVGDAMGAPVEFMGLKEIFRRYGEKGVAGFEKAYGRIGAITDDTQMSLFTVEGLILSKARKTYSDENSVVLAIYHAYLRWLYTQETQLQQELINTHGTCSVVDGMLTGYSEIYSRRTPGNSCLSALRSGKMGTTKQPINDSKGCGGVMRAAPIGIAFSDPETAFRRGCDSAAITHGHPSGYLAAGFFSALISMSLSGKTLKEAILESTSLLTSCEDSEECLQAVEAAVALSSVSNLSPEEIETLGNGWVAQEALAIGLCCSLSAGQDFQKGVLLSVNHSGNSDSTGSITGNIIGAQQGQDVIPNKWLSDLEMKRVIEEAATDLAGFYDNA